MFIVIQAVLLALSGLFIRNVGATYAGGVGGLLSALGSPGLGLFTFIAAVLFGVLVDASLYTFKIKGTHLGVNRDRLMIAMAISTFLIGIITYSASVIVPEYFVTIGISSLTLFIHRSIALEAMVLFMGPVTGLTAGYTAAYLWNRYLKSISLAL